MSVSVEGKENVSSLSFVDPPKFSFERKKMNQKLLASLS
jgi:hypothetical protein